MSIASDALRLRRASFHDARRRGDLLAAAAAAARLQAQSNDLDAREFLVARDARLALGRAIREARLRRSAGPRLVVVEAAQPLRQPRRMPFAITAAAALLAVALSGWLILPRLAADPAAGGGAPPVAAESSVPITSQSRGRVVVAVAVAPLLEQPQATTVPEPVAVLAPVAAPAAPGPSVVPGVPGGAPGAGGPGVPGPGNGSGPPRATPAPTPLPRPTPLPPLARGFARLNGIVLDSTTGRGVPDACVSLGPCTAGAPHTDALGQWTLDLPVGSGGLDWGLQFMKPGYGVSTLSLRSRSGYIFVPPQFLVLTR